MEINPILSTFKTLGYLSDEATQALNDIISCKEFPKNSNLLEIGQRASTMYYVQKGLARVYYYFDGKDVTDYFATDGMFIGAVPSLITGKESQKGIHLIEDSTLYYFKSIDFEELCAQYHDLEHIARLLVTFAFLEEQERVEKLRFYSMKERYELLEKKHQGIMNRCPLHYIASFLCTTQVSISRIRAGIQ